MDCRTALLTVLDQVDYTNGACGVTEMVGAVLPKEVIALARKAIADEAAQQSVQWTNAPPVVAVVSKKQIRNTQFIAWRAMVGAFAANANR